TITVTVKKDGGRQNENGYAMPLGGCHAEVTIEPQTIEIEDVTVPAGESVGIKVLIDEVNLIINDERAEHGEYHITITTEPGGIDKTVTVSQGDGPYTEVYTWGKDKLIWKNWVIIANKRNCYISGETYTLRIRVNCQVETEASASGYISILLHAEKSSSDTSLAYDIHPIQIDIPMILKKISSVASVLIERLFERLFPFY
ncbi:MAG: hypothetical protein DRN18_03370, partial [Thermoplasmata archaeon]